MKEGAEEDPINESIDPQPIVENPPVVARVTVDDELYRTLFVSWRRSGQPGQITYGNQRYLAVTDNDQIVFVKDGPPLGADHLYGSTSFGG